MKSGKYILEKALFFINTAIICVCANCYFIAKLFPALIPLFITAFVFANILPMYSAKTFPDIRTRICNHGTKCLKSFLISTTVSVILHIVAAFYLFPALWSQWLFSAIVCICAEAVVFWNGIVSVYMTSLQLGIKLRVIGIAFGLIPVAHIFALCKIIHITSEEVLFETEKYRINTERHDLLICHTKYPILLVHGVFFRDFKYLNYWGRIPKELTDNGAQIYFGEHQSASSVEDSAAEIAERIKKIIQETGCEKVNIIAHSKGGLDCRYAISHTDIARNVASLTTINTPHRGCNFADCLLEKVPVSVQMKIADTYNSALRKFGDTTPDFISAVQSLTSEQCKALDQLMPIPENIFCQSVGSKINRAANGKFPLNLSYHFVKHFDGPNDGLVGEPSFSWGENYTFLTVPGNRGISHGDMIDLNRENIPGFDVREFYVHIVCDLKQRGL